MAGVGKYATGYKAREKLQLVLKSRKNLQQVTSARKHTWAISLLVAASATPDWLEKKHVGSDWLDHV